MKRQYIEKTTMQGGNFWNGFAAGSISSLAASAWSGGTTERFGQDGSFSSTTYGGIGGNFAQSGAGMIAFSTIAGGAGSALTGGNFWQGAVTGLIVSGLNHALHDDGDPPIKSNEDLKKEILEVATPIFLDNDRTVLNPQRGDVYNCHSYAWSNSNGDPLDPSNADMLRIGVPKWDNNPGNNKSGYHAIPFNAKNQIGDRVVYYAWDSNSRRVLAQHSAIVTKVNNAGQAIRVTSKWGESNLYSHHPRNVPAIYGAQTPTFVAPNGATYPSRIYYRAN